MSKYPFTSKKEKFLWYCAFMVFIAIYSTLFIGRPLIDFFSNQNVQALIFMIGMMLAGSAIIVHGLRTNSGKLEWVIMLGLGSVFGMLLLRLGLAERSHLIEYSVLTVFIHQAIIERFQDKYYYFILAGVAFVIAFGIGVVDELIQILLPNRVFDGVDILFNGMAAAFAVGSYLILTWVRNYLKLKI